jgi:predicted ATPase
VDVPILTPDQRVRVFVSSTLGELAPERAAVRRAVERLHLLPVMFELGARPHPPRQLYRAYLAQSHVFLGIYWERYGWVAPGEDVSGLEDEYRLCGDMPRLVYVKEPAPRREPRLTELLARIQDDDRAAYKHFSSPRELAQLVARDLAVLLSERFATATAEVPGPAVASRAPRPALPDPPTSFVGRDRELEQLGRLVTDHRVVSLVGPGGTGKTRLAVEAARRVRRSFHGRVALVELAAIGPEGATENVPRAAVDALGLVDVPSDGVVRDATALLVRALRSPRTLLVFDNCEHVLDAAAALVARIVADCPGARVLATSREPLAVPGETAVPVAPLDEAAAVRLFAERAAAVRPGFTVTPDNRGGVEEICRRLDGLPLAIELAAARIKVLPPDEIARRLDDRFRLLRAGPRTVEPRQQTLQAMVDWSYALLSTSEQQVFTRLGVCAGGISLDGAELICSGGSVDSLDVLDLVGRLVDKSLVLADHAEGGTPRFRLLETLRAYAVDRLRDGEEWEDAHRRHAEYIADLAEAAWIGLRGPDQSEWFARLDLEHDNVRAALGWAVGRDATLAHRVAAHLGWFWWLRGHAEEGENWLRAALDTPGHPPPPLAARARAMLALLLGERGQPAAAEKTAREALSDAQNADGEPLTLARLILALTLGRRGEFDEASELLDLAEAHDDMWGQAASDVVRAALLAALDRSALRPVASRAVDRFAAIGDRWGELDPRMMLAIDAEQHGDSDAAAAHYKRNLEISRELGLRSYEAMALTHLGNLALRTGDLDRAQDMHEQAVAMFTDVGSPTGAAFSRRALGAVAERQADFARARALYDEILEQHRDTDVSLDAALSLARLGFLAERNGELAEAGARHLESLDVAADLQHPPAIALALEGIAAVTAATGDPHSAAQLLGGAASLRERSDVPVDDVDAADVQRAYERSRSNLDAETFAAAHLSGKKLTLTQLLDLARVPPDAGASKLGGLVDDRIITANQVGEPRSKRSVEKREGA